MRLKEMETLVTFSAREVKKGAAEKKERSIPLQKDRKSRSKRKSHLNKLCEN